MALKVNCTRCGKAAPARKVDGGYQAYCRKCGVNLFVPQHMAVVADAEAEAAAAAAQAAATAGKPVATYEEQVVQARQRLARKRVKMAIVACVFLLVMLGVYLGYNAVVDAVRERRIRAGRDEVAGLMDEGKRLAADGKLDESYARYARAQQLINERTGQDPGIVDMSRDVRREQARVGDLIERQRREDALVEARRKAQAARAGNGRPATRVATAVNPPTTATAARRSPRPAPVPVVEETTGVTDEQIGQAITKGVDFLCARFSPDTYLVDVPAWSNGDGQRIGINALPVYALLQCGRAVHDPRLQPSSPFMRNCLEALKRLPGKDGMLTYGLSLRAAALGAANRPEDKGVLRSDLAYLLGSHDNGAYSYHAGGARAPVASPLATEWDNSNSQYGLLGVWSAAEAGHAVPTAYWQDVEKHWERQQLDNGQWAYKAASQDAIGTVSMTSAGTASLFVTHDMLSGARFGQDVGRDPFTSHLRKAMDWWESGDNAVMVAGSEYWGYTLYGVERVGLASGYKYFGSHDWYRELAAQVIQQQQPDGSWNSAEVDTSYALLFLARGRHPIFMNKLRWGGTGGVGKDKIGYWANRPRDVHNLNRFAGKQLERAMNWQVVRIDRDFTDWLDAPILYIASHVRPEFADADYDKLRRYVEVGGLLFTQADGDKDEFNAFAAELAKRLFPDYPLKDLPANHPMYGVVYKVPPQPLKGVSNGARLLMVHSPQDISKYWQMGDPLRPGAQPMFELGTNLFVYSAGKKDLRNRLQSPYVTAPASAPYGVVKVARLSYAGNWDPEPGAWKRFANWYHRRTGTGLDVRKVELAKLGALSPIDTPFAHLTGTDAVTLAEDQFQGLRKYVEAGGVVLVDAAGGGPAFTKSISEALAQAFPGKQSEAVRPSHPLLNEGQPGMEDLSKARLRASTPKRGNESSRLEAYRAGKGRIIVSHLDITSGLLGTNTWGILGYEPAYAQSLLKNIIFWTLDGQPDPDQPAGR